MTETKRLDASVETIFQYFSVNQQAEHECCFAADKLQKPARIFSTMVDVTNRRCFTNYS
jgi:hypothetical protein